MVNTDIHGTSVAVAHCNCVECCRYLFLYYVHVTVSIHFQFKELRSSKKLEVRALSQKQKNRVLVDVRPGWKYVV